MLTPLLCVPRKCVYNPLLITLIFFIMFKSTSCLKQRYVRSTRHCINFTHFFVPASLSHLFLFQLINLTYSLNKASYPRPCSSTQWYRLVIFWLHYLLLWISIDIMTWQYRSVLYAWNKRLAILYYILFPFSFIYLLHYPSTFYLSPTSPLSL